MLLIAAQKSLCTFQKLCKPQVLAVLASFVFQFVAHVVCCVQVHAEGEAEHAAIGHDAVLSFVPAEHEDTLRRALHDHDRDFSVFYNKLADMLQ